MDLILKPTQACGWKCGFCSSTSISEKNSDILDHKYIFDFLDRFPDTRNIIVNGGDPLVMSPEYYWGILEYVDSHNLQTTLSFTSNLWDFKKHPNKWKDIFLHSRVGVSTSFQYDPPGQGRLKPDYTNYTEEDFIEITELFAHHIGYKPDFISVVTSNNEHLAIKNVELAKRLSNGGIPSTSFNQKKTWVECKLNYANSSGPPIWNTDKNGNLKKMGQKDDPYSKSSMYKTYIQIYNQDLYHWEYNTKQMMKVIKDNGKSTTCPLNRKCDEGIRCLQPTTNRITGESKIESKYYSCGAFGDDQDKSIDYNKEIYGKEFFTPLQDDINLFSLKKSCMGCPSFPLCNGCSKYIKDSKNKGGEFIESHCKEMKKLAPEILKINGFSEKEISSMLTDYILEN